MPVTIETPPQSGRNSPKPLPAKIWTLKEPPFEGFKPIDTEGYKRSTPDTAIVIDNGSSKKKSGPKQVQADVYGQDHPPFAQAGHSTPSLESPYRPSWLVIETES